MRVSIVCFGVMREYLPDGAEANRGHVELAEGADVGDLVDHLEAPRRLVFACLVDGVQAGLDRRLTEGCEVTLMPPFSGGRQSNGRRNLDAGLHQEEDDAEDLGP